MTAGRAPKVKGSGWERTVARFFQENGFPRARRLLGAGRHEDEGDILGLPDLVVECKNHRTFDLAGWLDQAEAERRRAEVAFAVVVAYRRAQAVEGAYAILRLDQFTELLSRAGLGQRTEESVDDKAGRLVANGCVMVLAADHARTIARVRGDSGVYDVNWQHGEWSCTCPNLKDCSHRRAVRLITTYRPVSAGAR